MITAMIMTNDGDDDDDDDDDCDGDEDDDDVRCEEITVTAVELDVVGRRPANVNVMARVSTSRDSRRGSGVVCHGPW